MALSSVNAAFTEMNFGTALGSHEEYEFRDWMLKGKSYHKYRTKEEYHFRFKTFEKNLKFIKDNN